LRDDVENYFKAFSFGERLFLKNPVREVYVFQQNCVILYAY
jgi:hypothetical protein